MILLRNRSVEPPLVAAGSKTCRGHGTQSGRISDDRCRSVRRLAGLLAGTALASVGFAGEAAAACNVTPAGTVSCLANTTTAHGVNANGATAASSDTTQSFNNGSNITGTIGNGVVVDGAGLNLQLSNPGGNNTITATNNGLVTSSSDLGSGAFLLLGNGGAVLYQGTGNVTNTSNNIGRGILARNSGAGGVTINVGATSTIQSASNAGVDVLTGGGPVTLQGVGGTGNVIGAVGALLTSNGAPTTVSNLGLVHGTNGSAISASTGGGVFNVSGNAQIIGTGSPAIDVLTDGGNINIVNNGTISGGMFLIADGPGAGAIVVSNNAALNAVGFNGVSAFAGSGGVTIAGNGNIAGLFAQTDGGPLTIQGNGDITSLDGDAVFVLSLGGPLNIGGVVPNGAITGALSGVLASSDAGSLTFVTGGAVTGQTRAGIAASGNGGLSLTLNHNVTGGTEGLQLAGPTGDITVSNAATLTGGTNAVLARTTGTFILSNNATGIINGHVNVTESVVGASVFSNAGAWNTDTGNSTFSGQLVNTGTVNAQNAAAGQTLTFAGNYSGGGVYRTDLGDRLQMGGTANLTGGTLNAAIAPNSGLAHSFVVLSAAGGLGGTTFATTTITNPNVQTSATYTPTDVVVNILAAQLGTGSNLNQNQQNVATSINNFFNAGGNLPTGFGTVFTLTGAPLGAALTQISGENASGIQRASIMSTGMFLSAMLDPFAAGRSNGAVGGGLGFAQEPAPSRVQVAAREAFAADMPVKAAPPAFEQRWNVWYAAYGGANKTDGDPVQGSTERHANVAGFAAGADYRVSRDTVIGLAATVGQTHWRVSGLGKGNSDVGQIGG
jgi:hypothetical protein